MTRAMAIAVTRAAYPPWRNLGSLKDPNSFGLFISVPLLPTPGVQRADRQEDEHGTKTEVVDHRAQLEYSPGEIPIAGKQRKPFQYSYDQSVEARRLDNVEHGDDTTTCYNCCPC